MTKDNDLPLAVVTGLEVWAMAAGAITTVASKRHKRFRKGGS